MPLTAGTLLGPYEILSPLGVGRMGEVLFDLTARGPVLDDYAPSADGQRILVKVRVSTEAPRIHVVVNWPSLLSAATGRKGP